jgi:hypothetical protein
LPAGVQIAPGTSMVSVVETLYKKQQFEAADVVLGLALNNPQTTAADRVQLHVLEGMLRMESFQEPQARKAFTEAFNLDRQATLPEFAPPATRQLFVDVKATLPAVIAGTGGGFVIASHVVDGSLTGGTAQITTQDQLRSTVANGKLYQTAGYTMVGVGGAILIGGLVWKLAPDVAPLFTASLAPGGHGVAAVVSGSFP